ncbi:MAG: GNAT family N-acetyltransferase [Muribaculaceae bacterium]|nr:GNAT family N-acetyltransferase [Muribaculaceae bacterium]
MDYGVEIREIPMSLRSSLDAIDGLLSANNLRRDEMSVYYGIFDSEDTLVGGGGLDTRHGIIKCVAISPDYRGSGVANSLISRLRAEARLHGFNRITVSTKPEYEVLFRDLAFHPVGSTDEAVLLESTARGLKDYLESLSAHRKAGRNGIIVMNANPFTIGHRYLVASSAAKVDNLYVLVVEDDRSIFPYSIRRKMVEKGTGDLPNVTVLSTGAYSVSTETFPSYFLKQRDDATDVSIKLDLDIFVRHIAPALGATVRFAGSEPADPLTARYNELMAEILPKHGIEFREIERIGDSGSLVVSASRLRKYLADGEFEDALGIYGSDPAILLAWLARNALTAELDLTPKPGLVDRHDNGAHTDMDYRLMLRSIDALTPGLMEIAAETGSEPNIDAGIRTENHMFEATNGINTHKGAIFAMGLTLYCANKLIRHGRRLTPESLSMEIAAAAAGLKGGHNTHGETVRKNTCSKAGALEMARSGYASLFNSWLPFLRSNRNGQLALHRLLLKIITELDDTNVLHRAGESGAAWLRNRAGEVLENCSLASVEALNRDCIERNISPGGAADMLALTILIDSIVLQ